DFFQESSSEDPDSGRNHIDISGLPGGERAFKQVASFCYGMDFKISPLDAPALACAAAFLGMTDDSRKGMGKYRVNLLSFAAAAMAGMLKHADAALAVLRGCAGLLAEADALGIVDEAADRLADHAVTSHNLCTTPIHTCAEQGGSSPMHPWTICSCFIRSSLLSNQPNLACHLPSLTPLSLSHSRAGALFTDASLDDLLMLETSDVQVWSGGGGLGSGAEGLNAFGRASSLDDLLMLETSDVQVGSGAGEGLLHGFASEEHLSTLPDRAQALQAAAALIDSYLLHLSSPPTPYPDAAASASHSSPAPFFSPPYRQQQHSSTLYLLHLSSPPTPYPDAAADGTSATVAPEWKHLVCALPADARPSHDGLLKVRGNAAGTPPPPRQPQPPSQSMVERKHLVTALPADAWQSHDALLKAVTAYLTAVGAGLADWEVATLVGVVAPSRLSTSAMEAAAACSLLPPPFLVSILRIQKEEARAALQQQQRQVEAEEVETRKAEAAVGQLKERVAAQRGRKREIQRELLVVK
ncbi:unnamed protein product, partial [Closterium sp. Naga37s-1]